MRESVCNRLIDIFYRNIKGSILIEFAFAIPVFLALIYYIHDAPQAQRWQQQMRFVSEQIIQGIQTVSQSRSTDKKRITLTDLKHIFCSSFLSIFDGTSMFAISKCKCKYGYFPHFSILSIRGIEYGRAKVIWRKDMVSDPDQTFNPGQLYMVGNANSIIKASAGDIISTSELNCKIEPGENRIIVEICLWYENSGYYKFPDGTPTGSVPPQKAFGFLIHNPTHPRSVKHTYFHKLMVFTPKPGLFDDNIPS